MPRTATLPSLDEQIAAAALELDQVRAEQARVPHYLRGNSRLYLGLAERRQKLLATLESLRRLRQLTEA